MSTDETNEPIGGPTMEETKETESPPGPIAAEPGGDDDIADFEALLREIAELKSEDTIVEHISIDEYRRSKQP